MATLALSTLTVMTPAHASRTPPADGTYRCTIQLSLRAGKHHNILAFARVHTCEPRRLSSMTIVQITFQRDGTTVRAVPKKQCGADISGDAGPIKACLITRHWSVPDPPGTQNWDLGGQVIYRNGLGYPFGPKTPERIHFEH